MKKYKVQEKDLERIHLKIMNYVTEYELAKYLRLGIWTIRIWRKRERVIKYFPSAQKIGKYYAWKIEQIEKFLNIEIGDRRKNVYFLEPLLSLSDIAYLTNRSRKTVESWLFKKRLKIIKLGNKTVRVRKEDLDMFLDLYYPYNQLAIRWYYMDRINRERGYYLEDKEE